MRKGRYRTDNHIPIFHHTAGAILITPCLLVIFFLLGGCRPEPTGKQRLIRKIKGEWIEVRRTNTYNSAFNKYFGTFYTAAWDLTITDSNYLFLKIKDSTAIKKYPYDIFYDSVLVLAGRYWNNFFVIKQNDRKHLTLMRLPIKEDPYPRDTVLYHFLAKKYYQQQSLRQKISFGPTGQDTLYVRRLIHAIRPPDFGVWGSWYKSIFTPENPPTPEKWSNNIKIHRDTSRDLAFIHPVYDITVYHTGHSISLGYSRIEIDTLGKIYTGGSADEKKLMYSLFKKYVQHDILWNPATTLGYKHPADIKANIHYKE